MPRKPATPKKPVVKNPSENIFTLTRQAKEAVFAFYKDEAAAHTVWANFNRDLFTAHNQEAVLEVVDRYVDLER